MSEKNQRNKSLSRHRVLVVSILCLFAFCLLAQKPQTGTSAKQDGQKSKVYLLHADLLRKDARVPDAQVVVGNVVFRHDSTYMYCDSAYFYNQMNSFEAFSHVRMEQGDTLFLYGDRLFYDGMSQIAQMRMNVRMENRTTTLLTDSLNYDRVYNLGYFF